MENILNLDNVKYIDNNMELSSKVELDINRNKNEFSNIVRDAVDKGAGYVIRAMPVNDSIKDILLDVKDAFKTKDFKGIVKTAVNSSIREGLEILSIPKNVIKDISKIKDIALKGGLSTALSAGIDIVTKKYLKGNLFAPIIKNFLDKTKQFLFSNDFKIKVNQGINKFFDRTKDFKTLCEQWYKSYEKFDVDSINKIAKSLDYKKRKVYHDGECIKENNIIQNMTELINNKKQKLSQIQLQICNSL